MDTSPGGATDPALYAGMAEEAAEKRFEDVMLSEAKHLLFMAIENKSRFFSPTKNVGLQNDDHLLFSAACEEGV